MKNLLLTILTFFVISFANAQSFKGHDSGTIGILNAKIRLQYEIPIGDKFSTGANLNYYFVNWTGPLIEPFSRYYVSEGNKSGGFFQLKAGYGNLSSLNSTSKRLSIFGGGVAWGYKCLKKSGFTIEPIIGVRVYSNPEWNDAIGWFLTTGFPIDCQLKFGYQF